MRTIMWNRGLPVWLHLEPHVVFRTDNVPFKVRINLWSFPTFHGVLWTLNILVLEFCLRLICKSLWGKSSTWWKNRDYLHGKEVQSFWHKYVAFLINRSKKETCKRPSCGILWWLMHYLETLWDSVWKHRRMPPFSHWLSQRNISVLNHTRMLIECVCR